MLKSARLVLLKSARLQADQILSPTYMLSTVARNTEVGITLLFLTRPAFTKKRIRVAGGFAGVNPPMPKLAQGVYGKTIHFKSKNGF